MTIHYTEEFWKTMEDVHERIFYKNKIESLEIELKKHKDFIEDIYDIACVRETNLVPSDSCDKNDPWITLKRLKKLMDDFR